MSAVSLPLGRLRNPASRASRVAWRVPQRPTIRRATPAGLQLLAQENDKNIAYRGAPLSAFQYVASSHDSLAAVYYKVESGDTVLSLGDSDDDMQDLIDKLIVMPSVNTIDECIDVIFEKFNELQVDGDFSSCDEAIEYLLPKIHKIEPTLLVSFLVITLAAKSKLRFRVALYAAVESAFLNSFGEARTKKLLVGLK